MATDSMQNPDDYSPFTLEGFRQWLGQQPLNEPCGTPMSGHTCPVAQYVKQTTTVPYIHVTAREIVLRNALGEHVRSYFTPRWASEVIYYVDRYHYINPESLIGLLDRFTHAEDIRIQVKNPTPDA